MQADGREVHLIQDNKMLLQYTTHRIQVQNVRYTNKHAL